MALTVLIFQDLTPLGLFQKAKMLRSFLFKNYLNFLFFMKHKNFSAPLYRKICLSRLENGNCDCYSFFFLAGNFLNLIVLSSMLFLILSVVLSVNPAEGADAWLEDVNAKKVNGYIFINAELKGAFTKDIIEAISSGSPTRFKYQIKIRKNRGFWLDKDVHEYEIYHTVTYDVLKREYLVSRTYPDGDFEENLSTVKWETMQQWMANLSSIKIPCTKIRDQKAEYFLKIKAEMKCIKIPFPFNYLFVFVSLWNFDTPWVRVPVELSGTIDMQQIRNQPSTYREKAKPAAGSSDPNFSYEDKIHQDLDSIDKDSMEAPYLR